MWEVQSSLGTYKIGPKLWILSKDFSVLTPYGVLNVPRGFITDHASAPQAMYSFVPAVASCIAEGSIPHDYFYSRDSAEVPRSYADTVFKQVSLTRGASVWQVNLAYAAVRLFGKGSYRKMYSAEKLKTLAYPEWSWADPQFILGAIEAGMS